MTCKKKLDTGNQCKAQAMRGKAYCFRHEPTMTERALEASINGGERRRVLHQRYGEPVSLDTPEDIKRLIGDTINSVWLGEMPTNSPANSIGFLARCWLDAHEQSTLEERLNQLEEKVSKAGI